jgi:hypothetical protein
VRREDRDDPIARSEALPAVVGRDGEHSGAKIEALIGDLGPNDLRDRELVHGRRVALPERDHVSDHDEPRRRHDFGERSVRHHWAGGRRGHRGRGRGHDLERPDEESDPHAGYELTHFLTFVIVKSCRTGGVESRRA